MNKLFIHTLFILSFAVLYSILEIEIEGKTGGWANNIPTAKSGIGIFTYYHIYMNIIIILIITYSTIIIFKNIYLVLYFIIVWFIVEDFCWFVLNPYYTLDKYTKEDIWWHRNQIWIYNTPLHNIIALLGIILILILNKDINLFYNFIFVISFVMIIVLLSPIYHKLYHLTHNKN
jgi:hypothetical protein